jgi:hypothetical protein
MRSVRMSGERRWARLFLLDRKERDRATEPFHDTQELSVEIQTEDTAQMSKLTHRRGRAETVVRLESNGCGTTAMALPLEWWTYTYR